MPQECTPSEAARRLGTSTRTVQRWIARGDLPARRVGSRWRVAFDVLDAFAASLDTRRDDRTAAPHPIRTLFIANRGEIAVRIARTCAALGIAAVRPPTDGANAVDLLDPDAVIAAALVGEADAVHPGFGFLAENAAFAEAVLDAGLRWVGPPPSAIRAMGDKAAARRLAAAHGIPVPEGYDDADQSDDALARAAERIGFPLLVKPAAGGGGKGMRTVRDPGRLTDEFAAARREARAAFGDDRLILERLVEGARHVEMQVLFDAHGAGVHLGERDCSLQRRHQKVLEESPSPAVDEALRARMGAAALTLAGAVDYEGAGTCEFLLDAGGAFTFLEMNTRLQVEHPVTELVTGRDLVADQLRIAAGAPLGMDAEDVRLDGHAIEVRLYAEDAEAGFLPATGRIERLRWPAGPGIRVDAGVADGDEVTARFDPMLAKLIAHGADRAEALDRLMAALDATVVLGLTTNLRFLRWLVRQPVVQEGEARTDVLERIWPPDDLGERWPIPDRSWAAAATLLGAAPAGPAAPWAGGFRLNAPPTLRLEAGDVTRSVAIPAVGPALADAATAEAAATAQAATTDAVVAVRVDDTVHLDVDGLSVPVRIAAPPDVDRAAQAAAAAHHGGPVELVAPMPGQVRAIATGPGESVAAGATVLVMEAMKMEHAVVTTIAGRVVEMRVRIGDQVGRGQVLAIVEP